MAYDDFEGSTKDGRPVFLYQFGRGAETFYFTASEQDLTYDGIEWLASPVAHDVIEQTGNVEKNELALTFPISDSFAFGLLLPQVLVTTITVFRAHRHDPDEERRIYWKGRVLGATSEPNVIQVRTENIFSSLRRNGCHVRVQRSCRHDLYGAFVFGGIGCNADPADFDHAATITSISGIFATSPEAAGFPDATFRNGMLKWGNIYIMIEAQSGATLRLTTVPPELEQAVDEDGPQDVTLYDGCNRGLIGATACEHFDQQENYGGFRWIPKSNPWKNSIA